VLNVYSPLHIEPTRPTLASILKTQGYRTAVVGKWHLGYQSQKTDYTQPLRPGPQDLGFDYQFAVPSNHGDATGVFVEGERVAGLQSATLSPDKYKNWRGVRQLGLDAPQRVNDDVMPTLTQKAVAWLKQQERGKPFFLYYTPVSVHNPVTPSDKTRGTSKAGPYGDWIHELDRSVALLAAADEKPDRRHARAVLRQRQEFFGSRPPHNRRLRRMGPFKAISTPSGRRFRVPYIVRWPGHCHGYVCDGRSVLTDTFATVPHWRVSYAA
jgi:arylsulfatase A-like enzyme